MYRIIATYLETEDEEEARKQLIAYRKWFPWLKWRLVKVSSRRLAAS